MASSFTPMATARRSSASAGERVAVSAEGAGARGADGGERDGGALGRGEDLAGEPDLPRPSPGPLDQLVDRVVGARRLVVEEREATNGGGVRHPDRVLDRAVSPPPLRVVLVDGVLRVVDQEVGVTEKRDVLRFLAVELLEPGRSTLGLRTGLVIGRVHDAHAVGLDPVSQRERRMVEIARRDRDVVDLELPLDEVVVLDVGAEVEELDREVRVLHLPGERVVDRRVETARAVDVPHVPGLEQRGEERQALDVVPVGVADEEMAVDATAGSLIPVVHEGLTELVDAGAAVEDEQRPRVGANRRRTTCSRRSAPSPGRLSRSIRGCPRR